MFRKRTVSAAVSIFLLGVIFAIIVDSTTFFSGAVFVVSTVVSCIFLAVSANPNGFAVPKYITVAVFAVAVFSLGALRVSLYNDSVYNTKYFNDKTDTVVLKITEFDADSVDATVINSEIGVPQGKNIRLYLYEDIGDVAIGDSITATVKYKYRDSYSYLSKGISLTASGEITQITSGDGFFYSIRKSVDENSKILYSDFKSAAAISKGVTIGDRSDIDSYVFSLYKNSGISHVLAISGLHISIIAMSAYHILLMLTRRRKISGIVAALLSVGYTALVGFTSGAARASIMIMFLMFSRAFMRRSDGYTVIFIALLTLLLVNPYSICSVGLQLSFLCTFGIILAEPMISSIITRFDIKRTYLNLAYKITFKVATVIVIPAIISFVSSVFSFPVLYASFDTVSYISPLTNIVAVPLFTYAVELALLAYVVAMLSTTLATVIAFPAGVIFDLITDTSKWLYDMNVGVMSVHVKYMVVPLLLSILMIVVLVFITRKRTQIFIAVSAAFCVSLLFCGIYNSVSVSNKAVVEYGSLDAEYAYTSYNGGVYVDIDGYTANSEAVFKNGSTSLKHYVILDYSKYTVKRLDYLSSNLKVSSIHLPEPETVYDNEIFLTIKELAKQRNCDIIIYTDYLSINLDGGSSVKVFGDDCVSDETLICFDVCGKSVRVLGNGFSNKVNCDIAIATANYAGEYNDILSGTAYASEEYLSQQSENSDFLKFTDCIRVEIDVKESDYTVYEP